MNSGDILYTVTGDTEFEILASLRAQAKASGKEYFAEVHSALRWHAEYTTPGAGGCRMARLAIQAVTRTTLPHWTPSPRAPAALRRKWQAFIAAGRVHEKGHHDNAVRAARETGEALRGLRAEDCPALTREAQRQVDAIEQRYKAINEEYDRQTGHGKTQGAWWTVTARQPRGTT